MKLNNRITSIKTLALIVVSVLLLSGGAIFSQAKKEMPAHDMKNMKGMMHEKTTGTDSSIVHKGVINLKLIDKNKDGKVYQDMMDYNVISDKPGTCPLCGMKLKEVSVKKAETNLVKSGFKVKNSPGQK